jgi:hypothetical protein
VRTLTRAGIAAAVVVATAGLIHTPLGRPVLAALGVGCPASRVSPAQVEAVRQRALASLRGSKATATRPAFGLSLDASTELQVTAWMSARGLACVAAARPSRRLTCRDVPASALPRAAAGTSLDEVTFTFFPDGRLLGVETLRRALGGEEAARLFTSITSDLDARVGRAGERAGAATAAYLEGGAMHVAFARYRYSYYLATITAMNLSGRVVLREQYESAAPAS